MKYILFLPVVAFVVSLLACSQEDRDVAVSRIAKAGKALNGEVRPDDVEHDTPNIVVDQQRKERVKQNTQWTPENQARYSIEYCHAQLEETKKMSERLDVQQHTLMVTKNGLIRKISDLEAEENQLQSFLDKAKESYREASAKNAFPMRLNGYEVSREKAQVAIVEASRKLKTTRSQLMPNRNSVKRIDQRLAQITREQRNVVALRDRLEMTLSDLKTKQVIDGEKGVGDALKALEDAMTALQKASNEPDIIDLMLPDAASKEQEEFKAIMAE